MITDEMPWHEIADHTIKLIGGLRDKREQDQVLAAIAAHFQKTISENRVANGYSYRRPAPRRGSHQR